jgi:hypothetical protein
MGFESLTAGGGLAFGDATSGADGFFENGPFSGGNISAAKNDNTLLIVAGVAILAFLLLKR